MLLFLLPLFGDVPLADYCSTIRASEGSQVPCSAGCRRECWQLTRQSLRLMALAQQSLHDSCTLLSSSSSSSSSSFPFASSSFPPPLFFCFPRQTQVRAVDVDGRSSLHWAAAQGHHKVVQFLLSQEPDMAATKDNHGCYPLHLSAQSDSSKVMLS